MNENVPESSSFYDFLAWLEVNKKRVAIAAIALTVVGFAIGIYRYLREEKELKANSELLALRTPLAIGTNPPPSIPASSFLKVANEFQGTEAADRAALLAAGALYTEDKYAEAQSAFSKFVSEHADSPFAGTAAYGVAASLDAQGKADEALQQYQNVTTRYSQQAVAALSKLALARIYENKKQPEQALKLYDELSRNPTAQRNPDLMMKREELLKRYPYLNHPATNAAAALMQPSGPAATMKAVAPKPVTPPPATAPK